MPSCLIVDAQDGTRNQIRSFLEQRRFEVAEVSSPQAAAEACRHAMPDIIVYDQSADCDGQGAAFIRRLRASRGGARPVILYCADELDPEALSSLILDGASECLMKPFDDELLEFKLRQTGIATAKAA